MEISREKRIKEIKNNRKKELKRKTFKGFLFALALGAVGVTATKCNNSDDNIKEEQTTAKVETSKEYRERMKEELRQKQKEEIRKEVVSRVAGLQSQEQVLDYIKEIYIKEYNKNNDIKIKERNVSLYKDMHMERLDKDRAINGDMIYRKGEGHRTDDAQDNKMPHGIVSIKIESADILKSENIAKVNGEYINIYEANEEVESNSKTTALKLAAILDSGMDLAMLKEEGSAEKYGTDYYRLVGKCEQDLTEAVVERTMKIINKKNIKKEKNKTQKVESSREER